LLKTGKNKMKITLALVKKELLQIIRDPSSLIIAFILPVLLLFIYTYGLNMDSAKIRIGILNEDANPEISDLVTSFSQNKYVEAELYYNREKMYEDIVRSKIKGILVIPVDFSRKLASSQEAKLQLITDGAEISQVSYTQAYVSGITSKWLYSSSFRSLAMPQMINVESKVWYNQNLNGRWILVPGSLAVTMTLIGILLTALVIAREWERGTMEALLSTRVKPIHIVVGKYVPYFIVGMLSLALSIFVMIAFLDVPFRGSYPVLFFVSALFLFTCLGAGLMISSVTKNQLLASMASIVAGFLPALMLSGLIFPIKSMPLFFQWLTRVLPPRYYVEFVRSEFLSGTIKEIVIVNSVYLLALGFFFAMLVYKKTSRRLYG